MGLSGGGTQKETTSTSSASPQVTALSSKLATGLSGLVDKGTKVYDKPLYTGLSAATQGGVNALNGQAQAGQSVLNNAFNSTNGVVNNGGYNSALTQAQQGYQGQIKSGGYNPALQQAQSAYQGQISAGGYNPALSQAQSGIQGYLAESQADAPGYAALRSGVIDDTLAATNGAFNASGRFAGGANVDSANKGVASAVGAMDYQNYGDRLNRMLGGNQALAGIGQTAYGNQANAISGLAGVGQTAYGNQTGALSGLAGVGQTAMGNQLNAANSLGSQFASTLAPAQAQLAAGSVMDADALAKRQAEASLFNSQQNAGWDTYAKASSILGGTAAAAGTNTTETKPSTPWYQSLLGLGGQFL